MLAKKMLLCFALILHSAYAYLIKNKAQYDYHVLSLTWPGTYCSSSKCDRDWFHNWDKSSFIIHGFWPSSYDRTYLKRLQKNGYDPQCYESFPFTEQIFEEEEIDLLNQYWPQIGNIKKFWDYQWSKHGTCYLHILKNVYKSDLERGQIMHQYFMGTVDKLRSLNITIEQGKIMTKLQLAQKLGVQQNQFTATCKKKGALAEIRLCYSLSSEPGFQKLTECPSFRDSSQCKFPINLM